MCRFFEVDFNYTKVTSIANFLFFIEFVQPILSASSVAKDYGSDGNQLKLKHATQLHLVHHHQQSNAHS